MCLWSSRAAVTRIFNNPWGSYSFRSQWDCRKSGRRAATAPSWGLPASSPPPSLGLCWSVPLAKSSGKPEGRGALGCRCEVQLKAESRAESAERDPGGTRRKYPAQDAVTVEDMLWCLAIHNLVRMWWVRAGFQSCRGLCPALKLAPL